MHDSAGNLLKPYKLFCITQPATLLKHLNQMCMTQPAVCSSHETALLLLVTIMHHTAAKNQSASGNLHDPTRFDAIAQVDLDS